MCLVMYASWEPDRKKSISPAPEWQGPCPEGSIQSITVLNEDCWKSCSFIETSDASFCKNSGAGNGLVYLASSNWGKGR